MNYKKPEIASLGQCTKTIVLINPLKPAAGPDYFFLVSKVPPAYDLDE